MLKLIKLEWKKNNIGKYVRNAVILAAVLCLFMFALAYLGIANDPDTGVPDAAPGNNTISSPIDYISVGKRIPGTRDVPIEIHWNF